MAYNGTYGGVDVVEMSLDGIMGSLGLIGILGLLFAFLIFVLWLGWRLRYAIYRK